MRKNELIELFRDNPVICAVSDEVDVEKAIKAPSDIIFLLTGDIININSLVQKIKAHNKKVFIHLDLIKGFSRDSTSIHYIRKNLNIDGVMSTKSSLLKSARNEGLFIIQRLFMLDSTAYQTSINSAKDLKPDAVEIMPGILPKIIKKASLVLDMPIIAGGLINSKSEVISCLKSGATSISTTSKSLWYE